MNCDLTGLDIMDQGLTVPGAKGSVHLMSQNTKLDARSFKTQIYYFAIQDSQQFQIMKQERTYTELDNTRADNGGLSIRPAWFSSQQDLFNDCVVQCAQTMQYLPR